MNMPPPGEPSFEETPLTRSEYIAALVHLYRGELQRANSWRLRLDQTTNWAIIATIGLLSFTFGTRDHPHFILILGVYMVFTFLALEARRFRFFDVWRARVRMIEENFYVPLLRRDLVSSTRNWGSLVAEDLLQPRFKLSYSQALRARLRKNYLPLLLVLLVAWMLKTLLYPAEVGPGVSWRANVTVGPIPWHLFVLFEALPYVIVAYLLFFVKSTRPSELEYWTNLRKAEDVGDLDV